MIALIKQFFKSLFTHNLPHTDSDKLKDNIHLLSEGGDLPTMVVINSQKACSTESASLEDLLQTSLTEGLTSKEASHRQRLYGYNDFDVGEDTPIWKKYLMMVCFTKLSVYFVST